MNRNRIVRLTLVALLLLGFVPVLTWHFSIHRELYREPHHEPKVSPSPNAATIPITTAPVTDVTQTTSSPEPDLCFTESFHHHSLPSHEDGEECLEHRNAILLAHSDANPKSICVEVNGDPVKHTWKAKGRIEIGAIAGPQAEINISYCLGKALCSKTCKPKNDRFLSALGISADSIEKNTPLAAWSKDVNPESIKTETALYNEMQALRNEMQGKKEKIFDGWDRISAQDSCPAQHIKDLAVR